MQTKRYGSHKEKVILKSIEQNRHNHVTTTYYLLKRKIEREGESWLHRELKETRIVKYQNLNFSVDNKQSPIVCLDNSQIE